MEDETLRKDGLGYVYEPDGIGIRLTVDYLHRKTDEVTGEVLIESVMPGMPSHLHQARLNMTSTSARHTLSTHLQRTTGDAVPWEQVIEQFCVAVLRRERAGTPFQRVGRLPASPAHPDLIAGFLPSGSISSLYGPGGTGKSWLATCAAVCVASGTPFAQLPVQSGEVMYMDWEEPSEGDVILDRRIKYVSTGLGLTEPPEIDYRRCGQPLREMVHTVARRVADQETSLLILDSVEAGSGTASENAPYQTRAEGYFEAIRYIMSAVTHPVTVLCIDHVSEEARKNDKTVNKAINSVMKGNWVRCAWEVRSDQEANAKQSHLGLYHFKGNHTEKRGPLGFQLDFTEPGIVYLSQEDPGANANLRQRLPVQDQIAGAMMEHGRVLDTKQIEEFTGLSANTVRGTLNRYDMRFTKTSDGRWTLRDDRKRNGVSTRDEPPVRMERLPSGETIPF